MVSKACVKNQALMMGVATGDMPDVDFVWLKQRAEGGEACFGQSRDCTRRDCRWRAQCVALDFFANTHLALVALDSRKVGQVEHGRRTDAAAGADGVAVADEAVTAVTEKETVIEQAPFVESESPSAGTAELAADIREKVNTCVK